MYHVDEISPRLGVPKHGRQVRSLAVRDQGRHGDLRVRVGQALIQVLCYFYLYGHSPYVSVEKMRDTCIHIKNCTFGNIRRNIMKR